MEKQEMGEICSWEQEGLVEKLKPNKVEGEPQYGDTQRRKQELSGEQVKATPGRKGECKLRRKRLTQAKETDR